MSQDKEVKSKPTYTELDKKVATLEKTLQYVQKENERNKSAKEQAQADRDTALMLNSQLREHLSGYDAKITQKDAKIEELQRYNSNTKREINDTKQKEGEWKARVQHSEEVIVSLERECTKLRDEVNKGKVRISSLQKEVERFTKEEINYLQTINEHNSINKMQEDNMVSLAETKKKMARDIAQLQAHISQLSQTNRKLLDEMNAIHSGKVTLKDEVASLKTQYAQAQMEAMQLHSQANEQKNQAKKQDEEILILRQKLEMSQKKEENLNSDLLKMDKQLEEKETMIRQQAQELRQFKQQCDQARQQASEFSARVTGAEQKLNAAQEIVAAAQQRATTAENQLKTAQEKVNTSQRAMDALQSQVQVLQTKYEEAQIRATGAEKKVNATQEIVAAAQHRANKAEQQLKTMHENANSSQKEKEALQKQVQALQAKYEEARNLANKTEERLKEIIEKAQRQANQTKLTTEKSALELQTKVTQVDQELKALTTENSELKKQILQLEQDIAKLETSQASLKSSGGKQEHAENFVLDLTGQTKSSIIEFIIQQACKLEGSGDIPLAAKYYKVALNEADESSELHNQARKSIASLKEQKALARKKETQEKSQIIENEIKELQAQLAMAKKEDAEQLELMKGELEKEKAKQEEKMRIIEEQAQKMKEYEDKIKGWNEKLQVQQPERREEHELLASVHTASDKAAENRSDFNEKMAKAEEAREKLAHSEKELKQKEERLNFYIRMVEDQIGNQQLNEHLHAIKDYSVRVGHTPKKCFISYAWHPQEKENGELQARLVKLKEDLERAGIAALLDITNMEGNIDKYMAEGIQNCNFVIMICTPRFKERTEDKTTTPNNLQKEYRAALLRQSQDDKFIIPIMLEGSHQTSITAEISQILYTDFTDHNKYCENMVNLNPKGLIPKILGLEGDRTYAYMVKGYHSSRELLLHKI